MDFSHIDNNGNAQMVDISHKPEQIRVAVAEGEINLTPETINKIRSNEIAKGNVLTIAQIAGIQAAKRTHEIIPLCHPINTTKIDVSFEIKNNNIKVTSQAKSVGKTGAEMEALTAVSAALLTIYDMCKAVDKNMMISEIKLLKKEKNNV
ncbi:MAG: cyclic pyranopterin monophosphate synthase MoaC [Deltaproteobacteria bacterium CG07_land_8_20_14_0_80_38_7]|nr:MAG: cyclic pyranopterin monophosphate synthase MoaC [Deltaproteobacteria bacterium CG07_land_8_20_14_0_80_38_7]